MGQVSFNVPMIPQGDNPICWVACVAMVTSFKTRATHSIGEFTGGFDPSNSCIPNPSGSWSDLTSRLNGFGFTVDGANMSLDSSYFETMLRSHGPFIIFIFVVDFPFSGPMCLNMNASPSDTHALVVRGVDTDAGTVSLQNPWGTLIPPADISVVLASMQRLSDGGKNPVAFMW